MSARLDPVRQRGEVPAAGENEAQLRAFAAQERERLEQPVVVLVRPGARGIEQERLAFHAARSEHRVVEPEWDDSDPGRIEAKPGEGALANELAHHDHAVCAANRTVPGDLAEKPLRAREHGRQVEVLEVVERHYARRRLAGIRSVSG